MNVIYFSGWFCLVCALALFSPASRAYSLQFVYPTDGTYVTKSNYLIIKGGRDPFLDGMSIEINGVKSDIIDLTSTKYRDFFADMLLLEPLFDPGENQVIVEGYLGGEKFSSSEMNIFYYDDQSKPLPPGFNRESFHLAKREEPCTECHDMQPTEISAADPRPTSNPCASCHKRMLNENHVHGPAGVYQCLYCHDANSSPLRYEAKKGDALVCKECHVDKMEEFAMSSFVHGPVEVGMCLVCHDPHASAQPMQLVTKLNTLCLSCHANVTKSAHVASGTSASSHPLEGKMNPSNDKKAFNCSSCHDPHSGSHTNYFINGVTGRMRLCAVCHKK